MSKSYKSFVKEYAMGLQVPATSYLKPIGLRKKEFRFQANLYERKKVLN